MKKVLFIVLTLSSITTFGKANKSGSVRKIFRQMHRELKHGKHYQRLGEIFKNLVELDYQGDNLSDALSDELEQDQELREIFLKAQNKANKSNRNNYYINTSVCEAGREIDSVHFLLIGTDCGGEEIIVGPGLYVGAQVSAKICLSQESFKGVGFAVDLAPLVGVGAAAYVGKGFCLRLGFGFGFGVRAGIGWMNI